MNELSKKDFFGWKTELIMYSDSKEKIRAFVCADVFNNMITYRIEHDEVHEILTNFDETIERLNELGAHSI